MPKIKRNLAKKAPKIEIKEEKTKVNRGKLKDGEVDVDLALENRPMSIVKGERRIGLSKGATVPTVAYGNIKISLWEERIVPDDNHQARLILEEMSSYLNDWLENEVNEALEGIEK